MADTTTGSRGRLDKAQRGAFVGAFLGWLFDYYEIFLLTFLLVPIIAEFGLSTAAGAWLVSASLIAMAVGGVGFGMLADRIGRRRVLLITVLMFTIATFARAIAPNYEVLVVLTAIAGLGLGGEYGVGQSLISEIIEPSRRGWWGGLYYGGAFLSIMLAALVGGHLLPAIGWRWTFAISGAPVLLVIYLRSHTPESPHWVQNASVNRLKLREYASGTFLRPLALCLVPAVLYFWAYYGLTTLLPKYLTSAGFSMATASWWIFFTAVAGLCGCLFGSWACDRWGRRPTVTVVMFFAAVGGLIVYLAGPSAIGSPVLLVPFFILYFGSTAPTIFGTLFSEVFPTRFRSAGVSAALQLARGTSALPPLIAAGVIANVGYMPIFLAATVLYAAVGAWTWLFPETRNSRLENLDDDAVRAATPGSTELVLAWVVDQGLGGVDR
ncbi:MFS transporter [Saccharopolyspora pogona]|uniref:MFS transporter n=1 Tax=Saccharopolyspora pogona TaxID=333966 RepID=UPI00168945DF|nr:MFS transporter [Saccharopolyspora pogona]